MLNIITKKKPSLVTEMQIGDTLFIVVSVESDRARGWTHEQEHFVCVTYRKQKGKCASRQIRNVQVEKILLTEINRMLAFVRERKSEFVELLTKKNERDLNRQFRELEQATQRITKLGSIIQRLNIDSFLAQIKKYTEVKELVAEIIRTLVERIDVFTPEKVPGTRTKKQSILIHWNFIGAVELPQEQKKSA